MIEQTNFYSDIVEAISHGNTASVNYLLDLNPLLINQRNERGQTLLHVAASNGDDQADITLLLLSRGADKDAKDNDGWTAADWADFIMNFDVLLILTGQRSTTTQGIRPRVVTRAKLLPKPLNGRENIATQAFKQQKKNRMTDTAGERMKVARKWVKQKRVGITD